MKVPGKIIGVKKRNDVKNLSNKKLKELVQNEKKRRESIELRIKEAERFVDDAYFALDDLREDMFGNAALLYKSVPNSSLFDFVIPGCGHRGFRSFIDEIIDDPEYSNPYTARVTRNVEARVWKLNINGKSVMALLDHLKYKLRVESYGNSIAQMLDKHQSVYGKAYLLMSKYIEKYFLHDLKIKTIKIGGKNDDDEIDESTLEKNIVNDIRQFINKVQKWKATMPNVGKINKRIVDYEKYLDDYGFENVGKQIDKLLQVQTEMRKKVNAQRIAKAKAKKAQKEKEKQEEQQQEKENEKDKENKNGKEEI